MTSPATKYKSLLPPNYNSKEYILVHIINQRSVQHISRVLTSPIGSWLGYLLRWDWIHKIRTHKEISGWKILNVGHVYMPKWHTDDFKLKFLKKQLVQKGHSDPPLSLSERERNLSCERYPPCTRRKGRHPYDQRQRMQDREACIQTLLPFTNLLSQDKSLLRFLTN